MALTTPLGPGDFVKVKYHGRTRLNRNGEEYYDDVTDLVLMWDAKPYTIEVGKEGFTPFEAMSIAMGDPRSGEVVTTVRDEAGNVQFILDRATEVRRLRVLYDNKIGDEGQILYAPDATVTDLEGNEIKTVLADPEGESVITAPTTILDRDQLLAQVQRQQRMIEQLAESQGIDLATGEPSPTVEEPASETTATPSDAFSNLPEG